MRWEEAAKGLYRQAKAHSNAVTVSAGWLAEASVINKSQKKKDKFSGAVQRFINFSRDAARRPRLL